MILGTNALSIIYNVAQRGKQCISHMVLLYVWRTSLIHVNIIVNVNGLYCTLQSKKALNKCK